MMIDEKGRREGGRISGELTLTVQEIMKYNAEVDALLCFLKIYLFISLFI